MLSGELLFRFLNVMLLTALVAPLVLWRYRRAVLAGMQTKVGAAMPLAPPLGPRPHPAAASAPGVDAKLAWEARMRRRIFVAVVGALLPPALLLAGHYVVANGLPLTPAHLSLFAGTATLMAVPMVGVLAAIPFARTVAARHRDAVRLRRRLGRAVDAAAPRCSARHRPSTSCSTSAVSSASPRSRSRCRSSSPRRSARAACAASHPSSSPACSCSRSRRCSASTSRRRSARCNGAPAGCSPAGSTSARSSSSLPVGLLAWWRLKALARAYEAKRFSDAQLLAHSWWLVFVAVYAVEQVGGHPGTAALLQIVRSRQSPTCSFRSCSRTPWHGRSAVCPHCRAGCCSCCASSATARAPGRCSSASRRAGSASAR